MICSKCGRINPTEATYCYYDGSQLGEQGRNGAPVAISRRPFAHPFIFPSGRACHNFDELALACQEHGDVTHELLQKGYLESFLGGLGRVDLAHIAREATRFPDRHRGVDYLLAQLPTSVLQPAKLRVDPQEVHLGVLAVGTDRRLTLYLENQGMRLLHGSITCDDCVWLTIGEGAGVAKKVFQFERELTLALQVQGKLLRAGKKPLEGRLLIESNGGAYTVIVRAEVPIQPFPEGALAGACSPRQIAEKAKAAPKEAAALFERGVVARWYRDNGWIYPVQGPSASGLGAVQQFFEALGLTSPPKVHIDQRAITLWGKVGDRLQHQIEVTSEEQRPVYAYASSDQSWLQIGRVRLHGRTATVPLVIPAIPAHSGDRLQACVTVTSNGNQRFVVPVTLTVSGRGTGIHTTPLWQVIDGDNKPAVPSLVKDAIAAPSAIPVVSLPSSESLPAPIIAVRERPTPSEVENDKPTVPQRSHGSTRVPGWLHFIPLILLMLTLGGLVLRDMLWQALNQLATTPDELADPNPRLDVAFHDGLKEDDIDAVMPEPTMRFGLIMVEAANSGKRGKYRNTSKRLTYDPWGRSNNTCLRIDEEELLFGHPPGTWTQMKGALGLDRTGRSRLGANTIWYLPNYGLQVTQSAEIVPGEQTRLLDTCLVRYKIENRDRVPHQVGIRFLLDTYIGGNDGVPFTIPGEKGLCDTMQEFPTAASVPDFIQALEQEDLRRPGTVAQVQFRLGGRLEAPSRVTLGAWPNHALAQFRRWFGDQGRAAKDQLTLWQVPVVSMKALYEHTRFRPNIIPPDSAVTMYWKEELLAPGAVREVGFAYGLGQVASADSGRLGLSVGGDFTPNGLFTLTALVHNPQADETLTVTLPSGLELVAGQSEQRVPAVPANASRATSPVSWRIKAKRSGSYLLRVQSSTGVAQTQTVRIRSSSIFD